MWEASSFFPGKPWWLINYWLSCISYPILGWLYMTTTSCRELKTVHMKTLLIGICQQSYKAVFLQAWRVIGMVYEGARCLWVEALLQPLCLCVASAVLWARQVYYHFPLAIGVHCSLRSSIEHISRTYIATTFMVVRAVSVTSKYGGEGVNIKFSNLIQQAILILPNTLTLSAALISKTQW